MLLNVVLSSGAEFGVTALGSCSGSLHKPKNCSGVCGNVRKDVLVFLGTLEALKWLLITEQVFRELCVFQALIPVGVLGLAGSCALLLWLLCLTCANFAGYC